MDVFRVDAKVGGGRNRILTWNSFLGSIMRANDLAALLRLLIFFGELDLGAVSVIIPNTAAGHLRIFQRKGPAAWPHK